MVTESGLKGCISLAEVDLNSKLLHVLDCFRAPNILTLPATYLQHPLPKHPRAFCP